MRHLAFIALCALPAAAQTVRIEFESYPGPDGLLGTPDDVPLVAPSTFASQALQLTDEFMALGVRFTPNPAVNDRNEVLNSSSFTTPAGHTPPNLFASSGTAVIAGSFTVPVNRVSALIGISGGADRLEIFDVTGASLGSLVGDDVVVSLSATVSIASFRVSISTGTTPAIDNLEFDVVGPSGPVAYCTSGTTTNGCLAAVSSTGTPSASAGTGFTIGIANVEGGQTGIVFYGVNNAGFTPLPWGTGTSFLCVKSPLERMGVQSVGGTSGACDGAMSVDWNAYIAASPLAVGSPFTGGETVYAQGWFRDPPAPKTTSLSNALQFTVAP